MVSIPLEWRLSVKGGNEIKTVLSDLDAAFKRGQISGDQYNHSLSQLNRTSLQSINIGRYQNNIYLSQYPNILKISRALSVVTSITRGLLTLTNALNISKIRGNQVDEAASDHQRKANEYWREYIELVKSGKGNTDEARLSLEGYNTETALTNQRLQDIKDSNFDDWWTGMISNIIAGGIIWSQLKGHLKEIVDGFKTFGFVLGGLIPGAFTAFATAVSGFFSSPALTQGLPFFVAQFLDLVPGMKELKQNFSDWLHSLGELDATWLDQAIPKFFNKDIPLALGQAGIALTQFFLSDLPNWGTTGLKMLSDAFTATWNMIIQTTNAGVNAVISGVNYVINGVITFINSLISAINSKLKRLGLGTIQKLPAVEGIKPINIPTIAAAKGFNGMVNSPTMFLAGEAGPEQVSITPNGRSSGGNTVIIHVAGSILTEKNLYKIVDRYQKQDLKSRGFTGFG